MEKKYKHDHILQPLLVNELFTQYVSKCFRKNAYTNVEKHVLFQMTSQLSLLLLRWLIILEVV